MGDLISRMALLAEYDRVHVGPPGGARKLIADAPAVREWIPVSERLPEKFKNVLTARKFDYWFSIEIECIIADGKWSDDVFMENEVTHWMPLPEPPKGEA